MESMACVLQLTRWNSVPLRSPHSSFFWGEQYAIFCPYFVARVHSVQNMMMFPTPTFKSNHRWRLICFLWEPWNQLTTPFQTFAHSAHTFLHMWKNVLSSLLHLQELTVLSNWLDSLWQPGDWEHGQYWLACLRVTDFHSDAFIMWLFYRAWRDFSFFGVRIKSFITSGWDMYMRNMYKLRKTCCF